MSPILEVLIGLVFIFSLLSILVTQINAIVAQVLRLRSKYLFDTVKKIIHDKELIARFVTHPLIKIIDFSDVDGHGKVGCHSTISTIDGRTGRQNSGF